MAFGGAFVISWPAAWLANALAAINGALASLPGFFYRLAQPSIIVIVLWLLLLTIASGALFFGKRKIAFASLALCTAIVMLPGNTKDGMFALSSSPSILVLCNDETSVVFDEGNHSNRYIGMECHKLGLPPPALLIRLSPRQTGALNSGYLMQIVPLPDSMVENHLVYSEDMTIRVGKLHLSCLLPHRLPFFLAELHPELFSGKWLASSGSGKTTTICANAGNRSLP